MDNAILEINHNLFWVADACFALEQHNGSIDTLVKVLPVKKLRLGDNHINITTGLGRTCRCHMKLKDCNQSRAARKTLLLIQKNHFGENHLSLSTMCLNVANACLTNNSTKISKKYRSST